MADLGAFAGRALRYGLVGLLNSALGFAIIAGLDIGLHLRPEIANAVGYGIGMLVGFALTKVFVFRNQDRAWSVGPRYGLVILAAFALNQLALRLALLALGSGALQHALAQLTGMVVYTGFAFIGCQLWVFASPPSPGLPES
jgi:putative flippase GtrA